MLLFPNALCCSLYEHNCVCAVTKIFTKFLPANHFWQLLPVTRKRICTFAGNAQAQLHFRDDHQRAFGISNISNWSDIMKITGKFSHYWKIFRYNFCKFWTKYFGEILLRSQQMVADLRLTDPLPELAVGVVPRKVREAIFIRKETSPTLNRDGGGVGGQHELSKIYDSLLETPSSRTLPTTSSRSGSSAEDGEGFLRNIRFKNVVLLNCLKLFLMSSINTYKNIHSKLNLTSRKNMTS